MPCAQALRRPSDGCRRCLIQNHSPKYASLVGHGGDAKYAPHVASARLHRRRHLGDLPRHHPRAAVSRSQTPPRTSAAPALARCRRRARRRRRARGENDSSPPSDLRERRVFLAPASVHSRARDAPVVGAVDRRVGRDKRRPAGAVACCPDEPKPRVRARLDHRGRRPFPRRRMESRRAATSRRPRRRRPSPRGSRRRCAAGSTRAPRR